MTEATGGRWLYNC